MSSSDSPRSMNPDLMVAVAALKKAADAGSAEAQFRLGMMYANGDGVPLDRKQGAELVSAAAGQGHAEAMLTMGWICANGFGVETDEQQAKAWYLRAAEQGSPKAQYTVATMYRFGQFGEERDAEQAVAWYLKAADQGVAPAQFALGRLLMDGKMVQKDEEAALQWLSLAHANGSGKAEEVIKNLLQRMSPEAVARARDAVLLQQSGADD